MPDPRPAITHARVLRIALPIVLSNATIPILGAVDTGVVGQLGQAAPIGAVGIGAIILSAIYWTFGFLRMATAGLVAQAEGAGNRAEVAAHLTRSMLIALAGGAALIVLQAPVFSGAFAISPASAEVEAMARSYMAIRIWSAPAAIAVYGITGWLIARERTRSVLVLQFWMNGLNVVLDIWFVLGLGRGVEGVALATFIAEWTGVGLGLWLCRSVFGEPAWRDRARVLDPARLKLFLTLSRDIFIRSALLQAIFVSFLFLGSQFGDVPLAANQILLQFLQITAYAMDGFAFAAEALVGQALGARALPALRRAALVTSFWGLVSGLVLAAGFALLGGLIIELMTTAEPVRAAAKGYLVFVVFAPVLGCAPWMLDGIFIGATRGRDMRDMMVVAAAVYGLAVLVLVPTLGNAGLWSALLISFVARGVALGLRYPALERTAG
jgi:MATE family multidrug resistance protein